MTIPEDAINVSLSIYRPLRDGPGGDSDPANDQPVVLALPAIYEREQRVTKSGTTGEDIVITATYFLNPTLPDGTPLPEIRERDLIQHTDATGRLIERSTIRSVGYWFVSGELDHVELDV